MLPMPTFLRSRLIRCLALLLTASALLALAGPAFASGGATGLTKTWPAFVGRLHVLILHLPIGLLIGAFTIEVLGFFRRSKGYDIAAGWMFVLGALASVPAVISGLLLASEETGGTETALSMLWAGDDAGVSETLGWHMWLGITLMVVAIVAAVLKVMAVRKQWPDEDRSVPDRGGWALVIARVSLIGVMVMLPLAGHLGGNMTKGVRYLFERAPFDVPDAVVHWPNPVPEDKTTTIVDNDTGETIVLANGSVAFWNAKIQPSLDIHCTACHDANKQNSKLRLDTLEWAMKGGSKSGEDNIVPGDPEYSELYRRVALPPSHEEFMPRKVKQYGIMSQKDVHLLGDWIQAFDGDLEAPPADDDDGDTKRDDKTTNKPDETPKPLFDPAATAAITDAGGSARSLSLEEDADLLTVSFAYQKSLSTETVEKLAGVGPQIAWLSFHGSAFTDAHAEALPDMPSVKHLDFKDTQITDAGLAALPDMPKLERLNLFNTKITDKGLDALKRFGALKKLHIASTGVTGPGVAALVESLKPQGTEVVSDFDDQFRKHFADGGADEKTESSDTPNAVPTPGEAAAKPINTVCPVSDAPVKDGFVSTFEGKSVGFCCNKCKGQFDAAPKKFAGKLK